MVDEARLPHGHSFMELVVVESGTGLHRTHAGARRIVAGSVLAIRPGRWHAFDEPEGLVIWDVYIASRALAGELAALRTDPLLAALISSEIGYGGTATARLNLSSIEPHLIALSAPPAAGAGDPLTRLGHLLVVLGELLPALVDLGSDEHPKPVRRAVISATDLLHRDPAASWTLPELARQVHTSAPYLCRCFARELGISPLRYLERFRLELAAQLLLESDVSITEIGARVGMCDPNYLARRFRATHGMSPSQYRMMFAAGSPTRNPQVNGG